MNAGQMPADEFCYQTMAHSLQMDSSPVAAQHQHSMMESLAYRLQAAKAAQNFQLVVLLEQEKQQLQSETVQQKVVQALADRFGMIRQHLDRLFWDSSRLQVHEFLHGSDHWWYAYDPRTGQCVYADSESEMRLWIEKNYQGR